jgi:hypothetical protein
MVHRHEPLFFFAVLKLREVYDPKQVVSVFDLGCLGVGKDFPEQTPSLPNRKKRSQKDLSHEEKEHNQNHSRKRMVIEHTICGMKKHRIMGDIFRNRLRNYDRVSDIVSGLVNHRTLASSF